MPTQVTLLVRGLAVTFFREDVWNIVFVCDDVHPLNVNYTDAGGPRTDQLHERGRDLDAAFSAEGFATSGGTFGKDFDKIFNLAAEYAHGRDKLVVKRQKKMTDIVWLKVPSATLGASDFTSREYYVQEMLSYPGNPVEIIPAPIATELTVSFEVRDNLRLVLSDSADPAYTKSIDPVPSGGSVTIQFDNDCGSRCTHNDFLDLYEFLFDDPTDRKFAAGLVKQSSMAEVEAYSAQQGNCDPTTVEPPPG